MIDGFDAFSIGLLCKLRDIEVGTVFTGIGNVVFCSAIALGSHFLSLADNCPHQQITPVDWWYQVL